MKIIIKLFIPKNNCKCRRGGCITVLPLGIEKTKLEEYNKRELILEEPIYI
jgi:hypothetical protein